MQAEFDAAELDPCEEEMRKYHLHSTRRSAAKQCLI